MKNLSTSQINDWINWVPTSPMISASETLQANNDIEGTNTTNEQKNEDKQKMLDEAKNLKTIYLNNGVQPDTSESRIFWPAQNIIKTLEDVDSYRFIRDFQNIFFHSLSEKWGGYLSIIFNDILNATDYKDILSSLQQYAEKAVSDSKEWMEEKIQIIFNAKNELSERANTRRETNEDIEKNFSLFQNFFYLLYEAFQEKYFGKYWDYYETPERKAKIEEMKRRAKTHKVL